MQWDFPAELFPPQGFFSLPAHNLNSVDFSAAEWQEAGTDDRNISVGEDDRAGMAEELCKAKNSSDCWQHFK